MLSLAVLASLGAAPLPAGPMGAAPPHTVSDATGPLDNDVDLAAGMRFEALIPEHTFLGMVVPLLFDKWPHLAPDAKPIRMHGEGDSGNYTGEYLAAQAWRFAQAEVELARLGNPGGQVPGRDREAFEFWTQQHDEALARATEMIGYYRILINIAREWQTEFAPTVGDGREPDEVGWIDLGGGLVPGEAGLLMRTCSPENASPEYSDVRYNYGDLALGPFAWEDGRNWWCIGNTSRDSYMGTIFGLSVALEIFGTDAHPALRDSLAHDLMAMTDYAVKYGWNQPRPHGQVANPVLGHNDLEGPISPLFIQVPLHRLTLVQVARQSARAIGDADALQRYDLLWQEELANAVYSGALLTSMAIDAAGPHSAYYKYQLHLVSYFNLLRLEPDSVAREEIMRALGVMDATIRDDGNAFFEILTYALTGEQERLDNAVTLHRQWLDYYAFHEEAARRGQTPFVHEGRCSIQDDPGPDAPIEQQPLECAPENQVDIVQTLPTGDEVVLPFQPGTESRMRAADPLPVGVRRLADFLWQKDPTITWGDHDTPWRGPSIDFLVTYWMIRYFTEVAPPTDVHPLPAWAGPRFK